MIVLIVIFVVIANTVSEDCNSRNYPDGPVCVCSATYCDTVPDVDVSVGKYQVYSTSSSRLGFQSQTGSFVDDTNDNRVTVRVNRTAKYQTIFGFGGAFTDSAGINIDLLPQGAQEKLLESYFSEKGIEYSLCRVPIGGTDFSTRGYSYDDVEGDVSLESWALQADDTRYKIPYIQKAKELTGDKIKLFASPWSAPRWMKTNNDWAGIGFLKNEYYQLWADYIIKFFDEYEKQNITFWGMTLQNEFINGFIPAVISKINAMAWLPSQMNKWIAENIGPTIRNSTHKDLKIMIFDDNRETLLLLIPMLENEVTASYVDGVAIHWYWNGIPISALDSIKPYMEKNDMFLLPTEACNGDGTDPTGKGVRKGNWARGAKYVADIIENLQYGATGWVDWNLALDEMGGPTYIGNYVDSPIIVNETLQEFYKQPMFYGLGHFSKFVRPDSVRIKSTVTENENDLKVVAFHRPDDLIVVVVFNDGISNVAVQIVNDNSQVAMVEIESKSINTILFQ